MCTTQQPRRAHALRRPLHGAVVRARIGAVVRARILAVHGRLPVDLLADLVCLCAWSPFPLAAWQDLIDVIRDSGEANKKEN